MQTKNQSDPCTIASDLKDPEGPVALSDGTWALVEMSPDRGGVTVIEKNGSKRLLARTGKPNGLAVDLAGIFWIANAEPPVLIRLEATGRMNVFSSGRTHDPFLWPNDVCIGPDGALYMTDSGINVSQWSALDPAERAAAKPDGRVYRIDRSSAEIILLGRVSGFANGIAFGPGYSLYVSESLSGNIYRFERAVAGGWSTPKRFANIREGDIVRSTWRQLAQPDGLAFGSDGKLYVAAHRAQHVAVLNDRGKVVQRIGTWGPRVTNLAFGPGGEKRIYVTEASADRIGRLRFYDVDSSGFPLFT